MALNPVSTEASDFQAVGLQEPQAAPTRPQPNVDPAFQVTPYTTAPDTSAPLPAWEQITGDSRWGTLNPDQQRELVNQYANEVTARAKEAGEDPKDIVAKSNAWRQARENDIQNPNGVVQSVAGLVPVGVGSSVAGMVAGAGVNLGDMEDPRAAADRALNQVPLNYLQDELKNVQQMQKDPRKAYQDYIKENPEAVADRSNRLAHDYDYFQNYLTKRGNDLQTAIAGQPVTDVRTAGDAVANWGRNIQQELENGVDPGIRDSLPGKFVMNAAGMIPYMLTEAIPGVGQGVTAAMLQAQSRGDTYAAEKAQIANNPKFVGLTPEEQDKLARQNSLIISLPSAILATKGVSMINAGIPARNVASQLMKDAAGFALISGGTQGIKEAVDTGSGTSEPGNNPLGNILGATGEGFVTGGLLGGAGSLAGRIAMKRAEIQAVKDTHSTVSQIAGELAQNNPGVFRDANHAYDTVIATLPEETQQSLKLLRDKEQEADAHEQAAKNLDAANSPRSAEVERRLAEKARNTPPTAPSDLVATFGEEGKKEAEGKKEEPTATQPVEEPPPKTIADYANARDHEGLARAVAEGLPVSEEEFDQHASFLHGKYDYDIDKGSLLPVEQKAPEAEPQTTPQTFADFAKAGDAEGLKAAIEGGQQIPITHADLEQYPEFAEQNGFDGKFGRGRGAGTVVNSVDKDVLQSQKDSFIKKAENWKELTPEKQAQLDTAIAHLNSKTEAANAELSGYTSKRINGEDVVSDATLRFLHQLQSDKGVPTGEEKKYATTIFNTSLDDAKRILQKHSAPIEGEVSLDRPTDTGTTLHEVIGDQSLNPQMEEETPHANAQRELTESPQDQHDHRSVSDLVDQFRQTLSPRDELAFNAALKHHDLELLSSAPINESNTTAADRDRVFDAFRDFAKRRLTSGEPRPNPSEPTERTSNPGTANAERKPASTDQTRSRAKTVLNDNGRNQPTGERPAEHTNSELQQAPRARPTSANEIKTTGEQPGRNGETARGPESVGGHESVNGGTPERGPNGTSALDRAINAGGTPDTRSGLMAKLNSGEITPEEYKARWKALRSPPVADPRPGWTEAGPNPKDPVAERLSTGNAADALSALQEHGDESVREALPRLEAQRDRLNQVPIHIIDSPETGGYYHDGKIYLTKGQLDANNLHQILAHEMAHAATHATIDDPRNAREQELVSRLERIRQEVLGALPPEIRDAYYQKVLPMIEARRAAGDDRVDYSRLTDDEKKWMPVLYALSDPHETVAQLYSSPAFRSFARSVRYYGDSWFERLSNWAGDLLGFDTKSTALDHFWSTADQINDAATRRPGVSIDTNPLQSPPVTDRKPITAEVRLARKLAKYNVHQGTSAILDAIAEKSKNPTYGAVAKFLKAALEGSPEVKIDVTRMQNGELGMYHTLADKIRINQDLSDADTERAILHELTHAVSAGKINAFMLDRLDQLTPAERNAISDLESLRQKALQHPTTPDEIKALAEADPATRRMIFQALDQKFNKYYGLINLPEFVSEALTNGDFQKHLSGMKVTEGTKAKGLIGRVWDAVSRLFGGKEDSVLSKTLERIGTVTEGGRRIMGADSTVAGLQGYRNRMMEDDRAEIDRQRTSGALQAAAEEGELPRQNLPHDWDDVKANPAPDSQSQYNPRIFEGLKDGKDVLERISQAKGLLPRDIESLHSELDKAFNQNAITPSQYTEGWRALDSTRLPLLSAMGSKEDRNSWTRRLGRWLNNWKSEGNLPTVTDDTGYRHSPAFSEIQGIRNKRDAATQIVRDRLADLDKAVRQDYQRPLDKLERAKLDQFTEILQGKAAPADFPVNTYRAIRNMRDSIDFLSRQAQAYLPPDLAAKFADNEGFYTKRSYQIFQDPRWIERNVTGAMKDQAARDMVDKMRNDQAVAAGKRAADAWGNLNPGQFGTPEHRAVFTDAFNKKMVQAQKDVQYSNVRRWIERQMSDFRDIAEGKGDSFFNRPVAKTDTNIFKSRSELPESYRQLLGEKTDPRAVFAESMNKLSDFLATTQGLRNIKSHGAGEWLHNEPTGIYDARISKEGNRAYDPLDGMYTSPEIREALKAAQSVSTRSNNVVINAAMKMNRVAKTAHTIDSIRSAVRNFTTQGFNLLMNGHGLSPDAVKGAAQFLAADWGKRDDAGMRDAVIRYRGLGLLDQDPNVGMLREMAKAWNKNAGQPIDLQDAISGHVANNPVFKALRKTQNFAMHFYATADSLGKIMNFEMDRSMLSKAFPGLTDTELDSMAAKRTRDTMPTWSQMSPNMKAVVNQPFFGPFAGYFGEATRAMANSMYYAFKDLKEGVRQQNAVLSFSGARRIAGIGAALAGPSIIGGLTARAVGMNDKDVENFRKLLPPWEQNAALLFFHHENGKVGYTNLNYSSPYSYFTDAVTQVARSLASHEDIPTAVGKAVGALIQNFADPGLIFPRIYQALANQNDFGNPIVNPNLPGTEQFFGLAGYALNPLWGGTAGRVIGSMLPAALGSRTSASGMSTGLPEQIGGELLGGKIAEVDLGQRLRASLNDEMDDFHKVEQLFTSPFANPGHPMTSDEIKQNYAKMEAARYHAFMDVAEKVQAARQSGVAPAVIHQALSRYAPAEQKQIMAGVYVPYRPSKSVLHLGSQAGKQLPPGTVSTKTRSLSE